MRTLLMVLAATALAGCAGTQSGPEASLCDFAAERPEDSQRVSHVLKSGRFVPGEINVKIFSEWTKGVSSAMARPKINAYRKEYRADCHNKTGNYWYPCIRTATADFSDIRGIGRAFDLDRAERIAVVNCERLTRRRAPVVGPIVVDSAKLECVVSTREICPLPE